METRKRPRAGRSPRKQAATSDILGGKPIRRRVPSHWRAQHKRLLELREALLRSQESLTRLALEEVPTFSSHIADAGTDEYDRDLALGMLSAEQDSLYQIDAALKRIEEGTYGRCEFTGKPIEAARLEAIPWTRFSKEAELELEKRGIDRRARLGPREHAARGGSGAVEAPIEDEVETEPAST